MVQFRRQVFEDDLVEGPVPRARELGGRGGAGHFAAGGGHPLGHLHGPVGPVESPPLDPGGLRITRPTSIGFQFRVIRLFSG